MENESNAAEELPLEVDESINEPIPIAKPEIAPPEKKEPKKRGRKPFPRDANGQIIRPDGSTGPASNRARANSASAKGNGVLTNEMVGQSINGMMMLSGVLLGPHMRLFAFEEKAVGDALGPMARAMPEAYQQILIALTALPIGMAVLAPRIAVTGAMWKKQVARQDARKFLLATLAMQEAEKLLSLETMAKEKEVELKAMAEASMSLQTQVHAENVKQGEALRPNGTK